GILGRDPSSSVPYGCGGGGSLRNANLVGQKGILISSLAKGFGAPVAAMSGACDVIREFENRSQCRMHCSPPSAADIGAAARAMVVNRRFGEALRLRLAENVRRFRDGLRASGLRTERGLFPIQSLRLAPGVDLGEIHSRLSRAGVKALLHE